MGYKLVGDKVIDEEETSRLVVSFYEHSKKCGIGRWKPADYIKIRAAGVKDFMSRPVTEEDKQNYPTQWQDYQDGKGNSEEGETPLTMLPAHKTAFALELKLQGITSIEVFGSRPKPKPEAHHLVPMWKQAVMFLKIKDDEAKDEEGKV